MRVLIVVMVCLLVKCVQSFDWTSINLPPQHMAYYFTNNPHVAELCTTDEDCPFKSHVNTSKCWGYEGSCRKKNRFGTPTCPDGSQGWKDNKKDQWSYFWKGADFGYVKELSDEMTVLCKSKHQDDSSLECCKHTRFCRASNIYMDFTKFSFKDSKNRFIEDVFQAGDIGGHCDLDTAALANGGEHKSPLQSWFAELEHYTSLPFRPITDKKCDIVIEKPTYLFKLDAGVNLYHHFCDFVNLYASQHLNNSFSTDVNIIMWDTTTWGYNDLFSHTWKVFSDYPVIFLNQYEGKKVCFKNAVFPLLARMRFGLYYNMPLIPGCYGSSFFQAFHDHLIHRLNIPQHGPQKDKLRVTILSRESQYRNILNEKELIAALEKLEIFKVQRVVYHWKMSFLEQIEVSHNSDILIGMHGAGLTHMLFQPIWAVVMEIYNCEDKNCYLDLARLRGVRYMTWEKKDKLVQQDKGHHPTLGEHPKFTNYSFDTDEFVRLVLKAAYYVQEHSAYKAAHAIKHNTGNGATENGASNNVAKKDEL